MFPSDALIKAQIRLLEQQLAQDLVGSNACALNEAFRDTGTLNVSGCRRTLRVRVKLQGTRHWIEAL